MTNYSCEYVTNRHVKKTQNYCSVVYKWIIQPNEGVMRRPYEQNLNAEWYGGSKH